MTSGEVDVATAVQPRWTTQISDQCVQRASEASIELSSQDELRLETQVTGTPALNIVSVDTDVCCHEDKQTYHY